MSNRIIKILSSFFIAGFVISALASVRIVDFRARRESGEAIITWTTEDEIDLDKFILQRSIDQNNWINLHEESAKANDSSTRQYYEFRDRNIYKDDNTGTFYYRLIIIDLNGTSNTHGVVESISGSSGIRHTWGSLKAIFR